MIEQRDDVHLLTSEHLEVAVLPAAGARLHRVTAFGRQLLRAADDVAGIERSPFIWGGYVMAPWCNRIEPRPVEVLGRTVSPRVNSDDGTAIHGLVHDVPWATTGEGRFRVERAAADDWPWAFAVEHVVTVADHPVPTLALVLTVTNLDDGPMPAGVGIHPWFLQPVEVGIPARSVFLSNTDLDAPLEPQPVAEQPEHDLRELEPVAVGIDATWTDLDQPRATLRWPADHSGPGLSADLETGPTGSYLVAAHIEGLDVAVEPQTHAPNGLRRLLAGSPGGLAVLEPGDTLELAVELRFQLASG